jgi:hypothetical protein
MARDIAFGCTSVGRARMPTMMLSGSLPQILNKRRRRFTISVVTVETRGRDLRISYIYFNRRSFDGSYTDLPPIAAVFERTKMQRTQYLINVTRAIWKPESNFVMSASFDEISLAPPTPQLHGAILELCPCQHNWTVEESGLSKHVRPISQFPTRECGVFKRAALDNCVRALCISDG